MADPVLMQRARVFLFCRRRSALGTADTGLKA
jgi:hypothetical protein